jgi:Tol biopolymer transport system component
MLVAFALVTGCRPRLVKQDAVTGVARVSPLTTYPGDEREPSLSPDGSRVAFTWDGEKGNRDIYVTPIAKQRLVRLTTDPAEDSDPAWSPDGKRIAFIRRRADSKADIVLIPAGGGPERILRGIQLGAPLAARMLAWSPDGKWLCFTNATGSAAHHALFLLAPESGAVQPLLPGQDNGEGDSSPAFSPDGGWLAFARFTDLYNSKLLLQRLSTGLAPEGSPLTVKEAGANPKAPVWLADGKTVLFLDGSRIMRAKIGGAAQPFYTSSLVFGELTIAEPGPRLVASRKNDAKDDDIWIIALGANGLTAAGSAQHIVQSTASESQPRFSPDGRWLAFTSNRSGAAEIWLANADGGNPRQLTHLSAYLVGYPRWSPDGRFLAFYARVPEEPQIYTVRIEDGAIRQITRGQPGFVSASWSLDGHTLYACRSKYDKKEIYRIPAAGGAPHLLWEGSAPVEVPGRKLLVYAEVDRPGVYVRSLNGNRARNRERRVVPDYVWPYGGYYPVEDGLYYVGYTPDGVPSAFRFYSFSTGASVDIAPAPANLEMGLTVTPDRTRLAYATMSPGNEDLVQIELK